MPAFFAIGIIHALPENGYYGNLTMIICGLTINRVVIAHKGHGGHRLR